MPRLAPRAPPAGEFPLASSSAAEKAEGDPKLRKRRGETVVLAFSQQGWGESWAEESLRGMGGEKSYGSPGMAALALPGPAPGTSSAHPARGPASKQPSPASPPAPPAYRPAGNFVNTLVILLLLAMQGATGALTSGQAELTWRLQFGVGAVICVCVTAYRWLYLEESEASWQAGGATQPRHRLPLVRPWQCKGGDVPCSGCPPRPCLQVWQSEHKGVQEELVAEGDQAAVSLLEPSVPGTAGR